MNTIKIGWGRREITTNEPVCIQGQMYLRISEGVHDPIFATALCVDGGEGMDAAIFCSCDVVNLNSGVIQATAERVAQQRPEIPANAIIMNATHTHSSAGLRNGPDRSPDGKAIYPSEKYREFFIQQCADAVCEAWDTRAEGGMAYGYGFAVVGHSRRVVYHVDVSARNPGAAAPNGHGVMYGRTNDDQFSHYEAGTDGFLNVMFTFDGEKRLTGVVVNVPCPSQISEHFRKLSADYWNEVRQMVAQEFGSDVYVLPQCAAAGDLSPRILHYKKAQIRRMRLKYNLPYDLKRTSEHGQDEYNKAMGERLDIAQRILEGLRDVYSWAKKDIQTQVPVRHICRTVQLARRMITPEEKAWCEENIERMRRQVPDPATCTAEEYRVTMSRYTAISGRNTRAIERFEKQNENPTLATIFHAVQIGEIAFATNRFELYMDYMHRIQARSPFIQTFVVQLAGDEGGSYLSTKRGTEDKGYSASLFCNQVSYEGGQQLVEETLHMLEEMKEKDGQ